MVRRTQAQALNVFLNARHVGLLERAATGAISFRYAEEWLNWSPAMPVSLSLPLSPETYRGRPVVNVFENLLPDAKPVRDAIATRFKADGTDAFALLAVAGRDCVGALQFLKPDEAPGTPAPTAGTAMSEAAIARLLGALSTHPLGMAPDAEDFRISIAGAQDKTAFLKVDGRWCRPQGPTPTTHIFKPPIGIIHNGIDLSDSVANEHLCLTLCRALGLRVAESAIETFEDRTVLVVTRFDRRQTMDGRLLRLPQEDFCQALSVSPAQKYQKDGGPGIPQILDLLRDSDDPQQDVTHFIKTQMVFWLLGATDGHAKNFSIAHGPGGSFRLTPLYDVLSAQPVVDAGRIQRNRFCLAMAVGTQNRRRMDVVGLRHFQQTEDACALPKGTSQRIRDEIVAALPDAIETAARLVGHGVSESLFESVIAGIHSRSKILDP